MRFLLLSLLSAPFVFVPITAETQETSDIVLLRFAWPAGLTAEVEQEWIRRSGEPATTLHIRSRSRMQTAAHPQGLAVRQETVGTPEVVAPAAGEGDARLVSALAAQISAIRPSFVVSSGGDFVALLEVERLEQGVEALLRSAQERVEGATEDIIGLLRTMVSAEALAAGAEAEWGMLVGAWTDAELEVGAAYEAEGEEPHPLVPGVVMSVLVEFAVAGRVPCTDAEAEPRCVELVMESEADPDALREAVVSLLRQVSAEDADAMERGLHRISLVESVTVIAEPGTLIPHRMETVRVLDVAADASGPTAGLARHQEDRRVVRFRYE